MMHRPLLSNINYDQFFQLLECSSKGAKKSKYVEPRHILLHFFLFRTKLNLANSASVFLVHSFRWYNLAARECVALFTPHESSTTPATCATVLVGARGLHMQLLPTRTSATITAPPTVSRTWPPHPSIFLRLASLPPLKASRCWCLNASN